MKRIPMFAMFLNIQVAFREINVNFKNYQSANTGNVLHLHRVLEFEMFGVPYILS